jgi:WS/DGAT/MGAT family acyltransferase
MLAFDLDDHRRIRKAHGGTVNDVVLATVAGALRAWLLTRGEKVGPATTVRALVPVSIRPEGDASGGNRVSSYLVDLPVGEPSAVMRLHQVSYRMQAHKETGQAVGAEALAGLAGFAPPTLHSLGARVASGLSKRWFNLVVTNVPGPQIPLYLAGKRLIDTFPMVPLAKNQALGVALLSYAGRINFGLVGDYDLLWDLDQFAEDVQDSLAELAEAAGTGLTAETAPAGQAVRA